MAQFRIQDHGWGGRWTFERCEGNFGGVMHWRVIDTCDTKESAEDRLAVAEGRITEEESAKRWLKRKKQRKTTPLKDEELQSLYRLPLATCWKT